MKIKKNSKVTADSCGKHNGLKVFMKNDVVHISSFLKRGFGFQRMVSVDRKSQKKIPTNGLCIKIHMRLQIGSGLIVNNRTL